MLDIYALKMEDEWLKEGLCERGASGLKAD